MARRPGSTAEREAKDRAARSVRPRGEGRRRVLRVRRSDRQAACEGRGARSATGRRRCPPRRRSRTGSRSRDGVLARQPSPRRSREPAPTACRSRRTAAAMSEPTRRVTLIGDVGDYVDHLRHALGPLGVTDDAGSIASAGSEACEFAGSRARTGAFFPAIMNARPRLCDRSKVPIAGTSEASTRRDSDRLGAPRRMKGGIALRPVMPESSMRRLSLLLAGFLIAACGARRRQGPAI